MPFSFLKYKPFEVFGDNALGKQCFPYMITQNDQVCLISVRHGRSVVARKNDFEWINIKGGGWTFGGPYVYRSAKDSCMMFGLMDEKDAVREQAVSDYLQTINPHAPIVLGFKSFRDVFFSTPDQNIVNVHHTNGEAVNPCLLYTQTKSPFRMADIAFLTDAEKQEVLTFYCAYFKCTESEFIKTFAYHLAEQIGLYHQKNVINDSLYWDNITLCAEIVDYEWLTVPNMLLPNGQDASDYIPQERKEKEIIYALEAVLRRAALFHLQTDFYTVLDALLAGHQVHNPEFFQQSAVLQKMKNKERFIY